MRTEIILLLIGIVLMMTFTPVSAIEIYGSLNVGQRTVNDTVLDYTYGSGWNYQATLDIHILPRLALGFFYETGYKKESEIDATNEYTSLTLGGMGAVGTFYLGTRSFQPFLKVGAGSFSYRQEIDNPYLDREVNHSKFSLLFGSGIRFRILPFLLFNLELQYVPLMVEPFEVEKDLGGFRVMAGLTARINL